MGLAAVVVVLDTTTSGSATGWCRWPSPSGGGESGRRWWRHLFDVVDALDEVAKDTGRTVPQVAVAWLRERPMVSSAIIRARNEEQLRQNICAVGWTLSAEQAARLDAASHKPARTRTSLRAAGRLRAPPPSDVPRRAPAGVMTLRRSLPRPCVARARRRS
ncbi:aldo/keto reductase [Streptomyces sp. NBC_00354]|uniref:aldo/keto reductase n=1 Tax=Streptomyces sp. NBC_00354 TaxID=2975723 RepID=UPI002E275A66